MNRKNVFLWFLSIAVLASHIFFLRYFVFNETVKLAIVCLCSLAIASVFYMIMTKKITHPTDGYTAVQAAYFYKKCKDMGIVGTSQLSKHYDDVHKLAQSFDFAKDLDKIALTDLYRCGKKIYKGE